MTDVGPIWTEISTKKGPRPEERRQGWVDRVIAKLAGLQYGVVALWQLVALGIDRGAVKHRVAMGRLHRIHQGVYAVGHKHVTGNGRLMAAVLACGEGAVLSHLSAAVHLGLLRGYGGSVHVTTTARGRKPRRGIAIHRARSLHPDDCTVHERIPCTSVARTLIDVAEAAPRRSNAPSRKRSTDASST